MLPSDKIDRMNEPRTRFILWAFLGILSAVFAPAAAQPSDYISQVNAFYADIRRGPGSDPGLRSDLVLFPALAAMSSPPAGVETPWKARMMHPGSSRWQTYEAWATADEQKAVVAALDRVTSEPDFHRAMGFGQPYGVDGLADDELEFIAVGLYTDLDAGGTPMLIAADFKYFERLTWLECLVYVEATRRAGSGDVPGALDVLADLCYFGRQMADREFHAEKSRGMAIMIDALERIRDVVYVDLKGQQVLKRSPQAIADIIYRLDEVHADRTDGFIGLRRIRFPRADLLAARQAADVLLTNTGARAAQFVAVMAQMSSEGNPLRLFSEFARWESMAQAQDGAPTARRYIDAVYNDFERRWRLNNPFDREMERLPEITRVPLATNIIVAMTLGELGSVLDVRWQLQVEVAGTRQALGLVGVYYAFGDWPNDGAAVRPNWLPQEELDPMAPNRTARLHYFVPGRAGAPATLEMSITVEDAANFRKQLDSTDFVLCSVGSDGVRNFARNVFNSVEESFDTDYLLWPPVLSLTREEFIRTRRLR